jgi:hypothetical protein
VLCILGLALYPQLILHRTAPTVEQTVARVTGGPAPESQLASKEPDVFTFREYREGKRQ